MRKYIFSFLQKEKDCDLMLLFFFTLMQFYTFTLLYIKRN